MILHHICIEWRAVKLESWTFNFHKVVQQHIWGVVVDFIPALSAVYLRCCSERMIKTGQHLAKLLQK